MSNFEVFVLLMPWIVCADGEETFMSPQHSTLICVLPLVRMP